MSIEPQNIEVNYYPVSDDMSGGVSSSATATSASNDSAKQNSNTENTPVKEGNIVTIAGGSLLKSGYFQSANYYPGSAGFCIKSDGTVEFSSGNFRGDITGASGTFSGTITATAGSIGGWSIASGYIYKDGTTDALSAGLSPTDYPFYAGKKYADRATAPFRVSIAGAITAISGTIGGFTITDAALYGSTIKTGATVGAGSNGVIMDTNGLRGYSATLGKVFDIPTDGSAPTFSFGKIEESIFEISTNSILRTSSTVGDGTVNSAGILINNTGLYACEASQLLANANIKILIDGSVSIKGSITLTNTISADSVTDGSTNKVFTSTEQTKLIGIAAGADVTLSAVNGGLTVTGGGITLSSGGSIKGGQTDFNTGTGFYLGYSGSAYKFSIGDSSDATQQLYWDGTNLVVNGSRISNAPIYGDGSDGDVTISANTTLTRDMYYDNLTVNSGYTLTTAGYRVFVKDTLTIQSTGKIGWEGNAGTNASGVTAGTRGAALTAGNLPGSPNPGTSGNGGAGWHASFGGGSTGAAGSAGTNGTNVTNGVGSEGVGGSAGGLGGGGTRGATNYGNSSGGAAGTKGLLSGTVTASPRIIFKAYSFDSLTGSASNGGSGGGGGGAAAATFADVTGGSGGGGGGAGSAGGVVTIFARIINNAGTITAKGGNGGNGANGGNGDASDSRDPNRVAGGGGGGSAGSGGSGGVLVLVYNSLTNTGTITAAGGTGGTAGVHGEDYMYVSGSRVDPTTYPSTNGTTANGNDGVVIYLPN